MTLWREFATSLCIPTIVILGYDAHNPNHFLDETKIDKAMKEHGLTENQAFLYVNGDRTLAEAKKLSSKVRGKRQ